MITECYISAVKIITEYFFVIQGNMVGTSVQGSMVGTSVQGNSSYCVCGLPRKRVIM